MEAVPMTFFFVTRKTMDSRELLPCRARRCTSSFLGLFVLATMVCGGLLPFGACPALADDLDQCFQTQDPRIFTPWYRPIAPWVGQIILPPLERRHPDGSVPFLVYCSPDPALIGRILRLAWHPQQATEGWFFKARPDVTFDRRKQSIGEKAGCRFPTQIAGWRSVSALESLPANRSESTIEVSLENPVLHNGALYITREPIQVNGALVCLARFEGAASGNLRRIRHFNPHSREFDGPSEVVTIMPVKPPAGKGPPQTSTTGIEDADGNRLGWYLYGKRGRNGFLVKSIEPRAPLMLTPHQEVTSTDNVQQYLTKGVYEGLKPDLTRVTRLEPTLQNLAGGKQTDRGLSVDHAWPIGSRGLLVHLFGWRRVEGEKRGVMDRLGIVTGHFSFGIAEVVQDPFTSEPRWRIVYHQVYGHNREEVVSGSIAWHAYMGNLRRGWMYSIPVHDTIIRLPELHPFVIGGRRIDPLRGLARELERMMALYRVGGGSGCSIVRPDVSCVQDAHCALYAALHEFTETVAAHPETRRWLKEGPAGGHDPERARFERLKSLAAEVHRIILTPLGPQGNWRQFVDNPIGTRDPLGARIIVDLLLSTRTIFPRHATDRLLKLAAKRGYPMWSILTVQVGGRIPGIIAQPATSPTTR
jgi:predicted Abi (CAAX) family protease